MTDGLRKELEMLAEAFDLDADELNAIYDGARYKGRIDTYRECARRLRAALDAHPATGYDVYSSETNNFAVCTFEGRFPSWDRAVRFIQSEENAPTDIVVYRGEWERGTGRRAYHVNYADGTPYKHYIVNPEGSPAPGISE